MVCWGILATSCKFFQKKSEMDSAREESTAGESSEFSLGNREYFPKTTEPIALTRLLVGRPQPGQKKIRDCALELTSLTQESGDLETMENQAAKFGDNISQEPEFYHWCFFQLMKDIQDRLEKDHRTYDAKAKIFLEKMRQQWVLAKSLDSRVDKHPYKDYLQAIYIQLSRSIFGRDVETLDVGSENPFLLGGARKEKN